MHSWLQTPWNFMMGRGQNRRQSESEQRFEGADTDWLPPVLGPTDCSNGYFIAMADREAGWYLERRRP
jgi:hypothetical protein